MGDSRIWRGIALLGGLQEWGRPGQKLLPERHFLGLCRGKMPLSDWSIPTNFLRDRCQANGEAVVGGREEVADFSKKVFVVRNQATFNPPLLRIAEKVERGAAQELQLREHPEHRQHPGAKRHFSWFARRRITPRQQGGSQMKFKAQLVAIKARFHAIEKGRVGV